MSNHNILKVYIWVISVKNAWITEIKSWVCCLVNRSVKHLPVKTWAEDCTVTFICYSFTCAQNQSVCCSQLNLLSSRFLYVSACPMGWIVKLGNYLCGMFPLIGRSPENGFAFLPFIFISIFSFTGFAERSYLVEVSLSFFPSSLLSQNKSWLPQSAQRSPFMFWGYFGVPLAGAGEETRGDSLGSVERKCIRIRELEN